MSASTTLHARLHAALLTALLALIGACHAEPQTQPQPQQATSRSLEGVLVLKGNFPHTVPVLQTDSGNWELIGADATQMTQLQRQRVVVTGQPLSSEAPQRQRLQVERVEPLH